MNSELAGTLTSKYPPLQLVTQDSCASAINRDVGYGYSELSDEDFRTMPGIELVAIPEWSPEQRRYVGRKNYLLAARNEIAFQENPENVTVEP